MELTTPALLTIAKNRFYEEITIELLHIAPYNRPAWFCKLIPDIQNLWHDLTDESQAALYCVAMELLMHDHEGEDC